MKKIGILLLIIGIAAIGSSFYIKSRVDTGKEEISRAQSHLDQSSSLFSQNPVIKEIGQEFSGAAQRKINAGKNEVKDYEEKALWLMAGGIICIVIGLGIFFVSKKK